MLYIDAVWNNLRDLLPGYLEEETSLGQFYSLEVEIFAAEYQVSK